MKTVASYSIKGGVGATSTAVNLAALAAADGRRRLLCDLDPKGAASYLFRIVTATTRPAPAGRAVLR